MKEKLLKSDERGTTAVEYGLFLVLIAVAIIFTVGLFGEAVRDLFVGPWPW